MQVERHIEPASIGCPSVGLSGRLHVTQSLHGFSRLYTPHCVREAVEPPLQHVRILAVFGARLHVSRHCWYANTTWFYPPRCVAGASLYPRHSPCYCDQQHHLAKLPRSWVAGNRHANSRSCISIRNKACGKRQIND